MNKNFESFKELYLRMSFRNMGRRHIFNKKFEFSTFRLPGPTSNKKKLSGRRSLCFVHKNLNFKLREDMSINCDAIQFLSIEISNT